MTNIFNFQEIASEKKSGYLLSTKEYDGHYKFIMRAGRCFPKTSAQAKFFIKECALGGLNIDDIIKIEALLNKYGSNGVYRKSKDVYFLLNFSDLHKALKKEFNI